MGGKLMGIVKSRDLDFLQKSADIPLEDVSMKPLNPFKLGEKSAAIKSAQIKGNGNIAKTALKAHNRRFVFLTSVYRRDHKCIHPKHQYHITLFHLKANSNPSHLGAYTIQLKPSNHFIHYDFEVYIAWDFFFFLIYLGHAALEPKTIFYKEESQSMATWSGRSSFILPFKPPTIFRLMASTDFHILLSYNIIIFLDSVMVNNFPWFSFLLLYARIVCLTTGLYL